ncbi:unnamed protein product [Brassica oleracea]
MCYAIQGCVLAFKDTSPARCLLENASSGVDFTGCDGRTRSWSNLLRDRLLRQTWQGELLTWLRQGGKAKPRIVPEEEFIEFWISRLYHFACPPVGVASAVPRTVLLLPAFSTVLCCFVAGSGNKNLLWAAETKRLLLDFNI